MFMTGWYKCGKNALETKPMQFIYKIASNYLELLYYKLTTVVTASDLCSINVVPIIKVTNKFGSNIITKDSVTIYVSHFLLIT